MYYNYERYNNNNCIKNHVQRSVERSHPVLDTSTKRGPNYNTNGPVVMLTKPNDMNPTHWVWIM